MLIRNLYIYWQRHEQLGMTLVNALGAPLDPVALGGKLWFTVKPSYSSSDSEILFTRTSDSGDGIEMTDAPAGIGTIDILAADTSAVERPTKPVIYKYELTITDAAGEEPELLATGDFEIRPGVRDSF
jgi:hypothetical protein